MLRGKATEGELGKGIPGAFFDVDGTLCASNVVQAYLDFRLQGLPFPRRWAWLLQFLPKLPYYLILDGISRGRFTEAFFRNYANVELMALAPWAAGAAQRYWSPRVFPQALQTLGEHRAKGHRIVLVSGGI